MKTKRVITILFGITMFFLLTLSAFALSWDGSSAGGSTNAVNGNNTGYVIRSTDDSACVVGYRFSVVNQSGNLKVNKVIDVYRKTDNGNNAYSNSAKFSVKYNKKQMIANKDAKMTTTSNTTNCYLEKNMSFATALPNPSGMNTWQNNSTNITKILSKLGAGTISSLVYGDKIIVEPLLDVCLAGEYQALTVSEIAYCGRSVKGGSSNGGNSNGTSSTWGFIANYTNRIWPNKLYTTDGQGLWTAASKIADSSKATFDTILTKGYGAGIAYKETSNLTYTIAFNGNGSTGGSTASMSMTNAVAKNLTANGFTKTGNVFTGWNTKADGTGTKYTDKQSVKSLASTQGATVTLYAQWKPYELTLCYDCYGSAVTSNGTTTDYKLGDYNRITSTTKTNKTIAGTSNVLYHIIKYNNTIGTYGLFNFTTFGLNPPTGYTFSSWSCNGKTFDQDVTTYKATDFKSDVVNGDTYVWLTAKFSPITYTVKYNGHGNTGGSTASSTHTYDTAKKLTANGFTKTGYTFSGWNTKADGTGTGYTNQQSVKNLSSTQGATINLYAQWTANSYTVNYNANGGTGAPSSQTKQANVTLKLSTTKPTKTGYTFNGWNTKSDGTGTSYASGGNYTGNADLTLYAKWKANTLTICYDCYGSAVTSKGTTTDYKLGDYNRITSTTKTNKTIAGTSHVLYHTLTYNNAIGGNGLYNFATFGLNPPTGYTFSSWKGNNKSFDQDKTTYKPTDFTDEIKTADTYIWLSAQFTPISYTVKYNGNGNTGGSTTSSTHYYDSSKTLTSNGFTKTGYTFTGWNTKSDGTGTNYTNKQSVLNLTSTQGATINLYAQWKAGNFTVTYNANGGSGAPNSQTKTYGVDLTLLSTKPTRTGYTFNGWNTNSSGTGTSYASGGKYTGNANLTLYAQWKANTYTVTYNANGGSGAPSSQTKTYGVDLTLSSTKPTRTGYTFNGWNTNASGTSTSYASGSKYTGNANLTLYAQWNPIKVLTLEPISMNAPYREKTEVITSFNIVNDNETDVIPSADVSVVFKVYNGSTLIKTVTKDNVVCPKNDKNLIYFKWTVPENLNGADVTVTGEVVENGKSYSLVSKSYQTCAYDIFVTPDTQYEYSAPDGYICLSTPAESSEKMIWSEWKYVNGSFVKKNYGIECSADKASIVPMTSANAVFSNNLWTMKSGYGIELNLNNAVKNVNGYEMPSSDSYTVSQFAVAKFPEFMYSGTTDNCRTLELVNNSYIFRLNEENERAHFTPLWFPDGDYTVTVEQSDLWTPVGMIKRVSNTNTIKIKDSAYDDWYLN